MNYTCGVERGLESLNSCLNYWAAQSDECWVSAGSKAISLAGCVCVTAGPSCPPQASNRHTHTSYTYGMWFPIGKASRRPIVLSLAYRAVVCLITCHLFLGSAVRGKEVVMESPSRKQGRHRAQCSVWHSSYSRVLIHVLWWFPWSWFRFQPLVWKAIKHAESGHISHCAFSVNRIWRLVT